LAEVDIELRSGQVARLVVPVILGKTKYQFLLDTGSSSTSFDDRLRPLLRARTGVSRYWGVGGSVARRTFKAPAGAIGDAPLPQLDDVSCRDMQAMMGNDAPRVDGILGVDALRDYVVRLDFNLRKISWLRHVPTDAGTKLPFVRSNGMPVIACSIERLGARDFVLDTGFNSQVALLTRDFNALIACGQLKPADMIAAKTSIGRFQLRVGVLEAAFVAGGHTHEGIVVGELPGNSIPLGVLGLDYLSRYVVTLDFPQNCAYLKPSGEFNTLRPLAGPRGVRLARVGDAIAAFSVLEDDAAAQWVSPGDILVTIDTMDVQSMSDAEIIRRLMVPTRAIKLVFRRVADGRASWIVIQPRLPYAKSDAANSPPSPRLRRPNTTR
jgi:predicted aspartyl protease